MDGKPVGAPALRSTTAYAVNQVVELQQLRAVPASPQSHVSSPISRCNQYDNSRRAGTSP